MVGARGRPSTTALGKVAKGKLGTLLGGGGCHALSPFDERERVTTVERYGLDAPFPSSLHSVALLVKLDANSGYIRNLIKRK
ncbi:hypothetical protein CDL15_Pgr017536 [Punica granatum]|nr:hypothetical protein CDL15_Pgr017536 [Punica granatum]